MHLLLSLVIYRRFVPPEEYMVMQFEWQIYWWPQTHTHTQKVMQKLMFWPCYDSLFRPVVKPH